MDAKRGTDGNKTNTANSRIGWQGSKEGRKEGKKEERKEGRRGEGQGGEGEWKEKNTREPADQREGQAMIAKNRIA